MAELEIRPISIKDHCKLIEFWNQIEGLGVGGSDDLRRFEIYLKRNPETNFVALQNGQIIATALGAHDGRRGMLRHVAVAPEFRGKGIGKKLIQLCLETLAKEGIEKNYIIVFADNEDGIAFWKKLGWESSDRFKLLWHGEVSSATACDSICPS